MRSHFRSVLFAVALAACSQSVSVQSEAVETKSEEGVEAFSHDTFDEVLRTYVNDEGYVDYPGLKKNRVGLDAYVGQLAAASPKSNPELFPTEDHALAYWINAYNALIMRAVIDAYPVDSVTGIMVAHGVFNRLKFPVGGKDMTLDDIEKGTLLVEWDVPEVHWAITCASMGCPKIDPAAWTADGIHDRLHREGETYLNSPSGLQIDTASGTVRITKYFKWYGDDFGGDALAYIRPFLTEEHRAQLEGIADPEIEFMDYDWRLNDQAATWTP